jgi:hypothetical protein
MFKSVYAEGRPQQLHVLLAVVYICTCAMVCFAPLSLSLSLLSSRPAHPFDPFILILVKNTRFFPKITI